MKLITNIAQNNCRLWTTDWDITAIITKPNGW